MKTRPLFSRTHIIEPANPPVLRRGLSKSERVAIAALLLAVLGAMAAGLLQAINF